MLASAQPRAIGSGPSTSFVRPAAKLTLPLHVGRPGAAGVGSPFAPSQRFMRTAPAENDLWGWSQKSEKPKRRRVLGKRARKRSNGNEKQQRDANREFRK